MERVVVAAWAETADGPGWANEPIWYLTRETNTGKLQLECLQPGEHTAEMHTLYKISAAAHRAMTGAVRWALHDQGARVKLPRAGKSVLGI